MIEYLIRIIKKYNEFKFIIHCGIVTPAGEERDLTWGDLELEGWRHQPTTRLIPYLIDHERKLLDCRCWMHKSRDCHKDTCPYLV